MEAIFSAADIGFLRKLPKTVKKLTNPAAYMGTITGCFLLPVKKQRSFLLLREFKGAISSSISETVTGGKQASNIRSRRLRSFHSSNKASRQINGYSFGK
uniref:Uncharacterized protein n=1 Tax=Podarcis muralis TaxID=64176 RepID=A0A670HW23_PODMU